MANNNRSDPGSSLFKMCCWLTVRQASQDWNYKDVKTWESCRRSHQVIHAQDCPVESVLQLRSFRSFPSVVANHRHIITIRYSEAKHLPRQWEKDRKEIRFVDYFKTKKQIITKSRSRRHYNENELVKGLDPIEIRIKANVVWIKSAAGKSQTEGGKTFSGSQLKVLRINLIKIGKVYIRSRTQHTVQPKTI